MTRWRVFGSASSGPRVYLPLAVLFMLLAAAWTDAAATEPVKTDPESSRWNLAPHADVLKETDGELGIDEVTHPSMSGSFKPLGEDSVNLGIARGVYWFRFTIVNPRQNRATFVVEIDNPRVKRVDFHAPGADESEAHQRSGTAVAFNERAMPHRHGVFRLTLEPGQQQTVHLRVHKNGSYRFNMTLWEPDEFMYWHTLRTGLYGLFYGSLLIMFLFNLVLFVLFRDRSFFFLAFTIVCSGLYMLAYQCIDLQFFWPDTADVPGSRLTVFLGLALCGAFFFSRDILGTARNAPRWDKVYLVFAGLSAVVCVAAFIGGNWADWLLQLTGGTAPVVLLGGAIICVRKGHRYAWGYIAAWGLSFSAMIPFALLGIGVIKQSQLVEHGLKIAIPICLALNSIALWQRFRELQARHAANLDRMVKERTKELADALDNVKTLTGLIPICSACKSIRDDKGYWTRVETYIHDHSEADFTHSICPECVKKLYPDMDLSRAYGDAGEGGESSTAG